MSPPAPFQGYTAGAVFHNLEESCNIPLESEVQVTDGLSSAAIGRRPSWVDEDFDPLQLEDRVCPPS